MTSLRDRCTELLGEGKFRRVYAHPDDPTLVVKVVKNMKRPKRYSNPSEWQLWQMVKGTPIEHWFVPCLSISGDYLELVQMRVEICEESPDVPQWLRVDYKAKNWGIWQGSPALVDYASTMLRKKAHKQLKGIEARANDNAG